MKETPKQYRQRILKTLGGKPPVAVQSATPGKLAKLVRRLNAQQMRRRPAPGKWCIAEILAHLADTEIAVGWRLRQILSQNGVPIQAFDQDKWAAAGNYSAQPAAQSIADFRALRGKNLRLLKSVPKRKWQNYGMHAERGKEPIATLVALIAGHDINHLRQVEGLARAARKR
jgi:hypothetical protein